MTARDRLRAIKDALVQEIDATHPEAVSRLDRLDGAGTRRTPTKGEDRSDGPDRAPRH